jgi:hypothetical protein
LTLPHERTRSVVETERFLREICRNSDLPPDIRSHANGLLRYYPSADQVFSLGRLEECLINDQADAEVRRQLVAFHQPLFCSSLASAVDEARILPNAKHSPSVRSPENQRKAPKSDGSSGDNVAFSRNLGRIRIRASEVFSDDAVAAAWLAEPNAVLGAVSPESLCATEDGAQRVLKALNAIEWGGVV